MRYKDNVAAKIETATSTVQLIIRGLQNRQITAEDTVNKLNSVIAVLESAANLVEKETQGMN